MKLTHARGELDLSTCRVMGIVNRTPDSFYDGGRNMSLDTAVASALRMVDEGADILDVGAVKAGPGDPVTEADERERLLPLVEAIAAKTDVPLSIESSRPAIATACLDAGAAIVNDVIGADDTIAQVCASTGAGLILMHNGGQVRGRPRHPRYDDVVTDVAAELEAMASRAEAEGVDRDRIVIDAGLDFGKTTFHSLELVRRTEELVALGRPYLVAASRKDIVGETLGLDPSERLSGSLALVAMVVERGAHLVRVHDVAATVHVVHMVEAVLGRRFPAAPIRGLWD